MSPERDKLIKHLQDTFADELKRIQITKPTMTTKLEQMQERARETGQRENYTHSESTFTFYESELNSLITEVWNEAIKECEGCVPEEHVRFED